MKTRFEAFYDTLSKLNDPVLLWEGVFIYKELSETHIDMELLRIMASIPRELDEASLIEYTKAITHGIPVTAMRGLRDAGRLTELRRFFEDIDQSPEYRNLRKAYQQVCTNMTVPTRVLYELRRFLKDGMPNELEQIIALCSKHNFWDWRALDLTLRNLKSEQWSMVTVKYIIPMLASLPTAESLDTRLCQELTAAPTVISPCHYKELEIILSSFNCNKACPYCTAKITKWATMEDDLDALRHTWSQMVKQGYTYDFITIGGNGEPTLHDFDKLKKLVSIFDNSPSSTCKRVLTSGIVFEPEMKRVFDLFNEAGYAFEITMTSSNQAADRTVLGYSNDYLSSESFRAAKHVRLNYVLLQNNRETFCDEVRVFLDTYPNIETVGLKLLNVNTGTGAPTDSHSKWIMDFGVPKSESHLILEQLCDSFGDSTDTWDTYSWEYNGHRVYFSSKRDSYGKHDVVWYGDHLVDYTLSTVKMASREVPKVYIASRFICDRDSNGELSVLRDFRDTLIKEKDSSLGLLNYSSNAHVSLFGKQYSYVGPFYNEEASKGALTSTDCDTVVKQELKLVDSCDLMVAYMDEKPSLDTVAELMYALSKNKQLLICYEAKLNGDYTMAPNNWFPLTVLKQLGATGQVKLVSIDTAKEDMLSFFKRRDLQ